jgi:hypothetical protein
MGKSIIVLDFFERKNNNSKASSDNVLLPTSNVDVPVFENP